MNFIYNADSKTVIDGDVKLETLEDLNREIEKTELEIADLFQELDRVSSISGEFAIKKEIRKFQKIDMSLIQLRKDRFGV